MSKRKCVKRCVALATSVVIGIMCCMPVLASNGVDEDLCPRCGDGVVMYSQSEVRRYPIGQVYCTHKKYGVDVEIEIYSICVYECLDCGYGWSEDIYAQYWDCQGYDNPLQ